MKARYDATEEGRWAFNLGSDARVMGLALSDNPYASTDTHRWSAWRRGWDDVDRFWGHHARWPVRQLPARRIA